MTTVIQGLDIRNSSGVTLEVLSCYYNGEWVQTVNAADVLTFKCPNEFAANLVSGNEVWLRRGDDAELVRKFVIRIVETHEGGRAETSVTAYDYSSLLLRVPISEYPTVEPEDGLVNTSQYLDYMLSLAASTGIVWGTLPLIPGDKVTLPYRDLHIKDSNVLAGLHNVRQSIGGMLWVDNDKQLHWYVERFPSPPKEFTLDLDRNTIDVGIRVDDTTNLTRTTYSVDVIDLSAHSTDDDGMLNIGMPVSVPIPNTEDTVSAYITDIRQDISNPLALQISVNTTLDTTGRFRDLLDYMINETDPHIDTKITTLDEFKTEIEEWLGDTIDETNNFSDAVAGEVVGNLRLAKLVSLNANGDDLNVYFYDYEEADWEATTTSVKKPYELQKTNWNGLTLTTADGRDIEYDVTGLDLDYQRHAVCEDTGFEFDIVEDMTPPYTVDGLLLISKDAADAWIDQNVAGRTYIPSIASIIEQGLEDLTGGFPDPTDGGETTDTAHIPLMYKAKVASLDADGDKITVNLYDYVANGWKSTTRSIYKPHFLRYSEWIGTVTYTDGASITYDVTDLEKKYQRRATWDGGAETEVQEITSPYAVNEVLFCVQERNNDLVDMNFAGRHWAVNEDEA